MIFAYFKPFSEYQKHGLTTCCTNCSTNIYSQNNNKKLTREEKRGRRLSNKTCNQAAPPKVFLFASSSSSSSSSIASSKQSPKSPRFSSFLVTTPLSYPSPPLAEPRPRSGSTVETPRKRSGTFSATVDHLTSFWEGKKDKKEKEKEKDKDKEQQKQKEKESEKKSEKHAQHETIYKSVGKPIPIPHNGKEAVGVHGREVGRKVYKEESKSVHYKEKEKDRARRYSKEANAAISSEVFEAMKGLNEINNSRHTHLPHHNHHNHNPTLSTPHPTTTTTTTHQEPQKIRDVRVKHKARSEGSLLAAIFSRKLERSAIMQKSSSLIELKAVSTSPPKSGSAIQVNKKPGYFGVTLAEAMEMQKEKYPDLKIPVIMVKLTESILLLEGRKAEGIFRVAGNTQQVMKMQQQFNDMNFDEISSDPHVLVNVLKNWLRELKEPLIPNSVYRDCLRCETTTECLAIIEKMPELNKATLAHFVTFLRELAKPEHLQYTKMDVHNLCLVSAPVLFRCPSTDMAELVVNMQKEKVFLGLVLESPAFM